MNDFWIKSKYEPSEDVSKFKVFYGPDCDESKSFFVGECIAKDAREAEERILLIVNDHKQYLESQKV